MKKIIILMSILFLNSSNNIKYCDIKGNVKNPGVYEIKGSYTIQDVVDLAGGLMKNSYTDNINLSKHVEDEMVIYIFNKDEIDEVNKECICEPIYIYKDCDPLLETTKKIVETTKVIETTNKIEATEIITTKKDAYININLCTKEDLLTLDGLGEKKAYAIIEYRNTNGEFKTIEDILNVDGIGKTTFDKIKNFITV